MLCTSCRSFALPSLVGSNTSAASGMRMYADHMLYWSMISTVCRVLFPTWRHSVYSIYMGDCDFSILFYTSTGLNSVLQFFSCFLYTVFRQYRASHARSNTVLVSDRIIAEYEHIRVCTSTGVENNCYNSIGDERGATAVEYLKHLDIYMFCAARGRHTHCAAHGQFN